MKTRILLVPGALLLLAGVIAARPQQSPAPSGAPAQRWYKGNTHTHTLNSDGDSTPDEVVRWYREHGYQFLVLTDHNYLTSVDGLNALHGAAEKFLVVRGEEVTSSVNSKAVHINGLNVSSLVAAPSGTNLVEVMQQSVDRIRKADGVPHINHPNFTWAMTAEELGQVQRTRLFEIFNGHPQVNNVGGGGAPGLEEIWDRILSSGRLMYGVAVDDAHHFKRPGDPLASGPGRGWIYVRTDRLEPRAIVEALERGSFYSLDRRRAHGSPSHGLGHHGDDQGDDLQPVPGAVHRQERPRAQRGDHAGGHLRVQRRRRVCPRQGAGVERLRGLDAAGAGGSGRAEDL